MEKKMMLVNETTIAVLSASLGVLATTLTFEKRLHEKREEYKLRIEEEKRSHAENEIKRYAAERDFMHLKAGYEALKKGQVELSQEMEGKFNQITQKLLELDRKLSQLIK
jgi:flagellar biosynthesis component FlhA